MARPKELFWVEFKRNGSERSTGRYARHWAAPKGGKFATLEAAKQRREDVLRTYPTAIVTIYTTGPLAWKEIALGTIGFIE